MEKLIIILLATAATSFADVEVRRAIPVDKPVEVRRAIAVATPIPQTFEKLDDPASVPSATPLPPSKDEDIKSHETAANHQKSDKVTPEGVAAVLFLLALFFAYLIPSFVASMRKHHNKNAIFLVNLFFGWTALGWVAALIWATTNPRPVQIVRVIETTSDNSGFKLSSRN